MKKYIYGAGTYGKLLLQHMSNIGEKIDAFVQTEEPRVAEVNHIPVISCETLLHMKGKKTVYIAMNDRKVASEIEHGIYAVDNRDMKVFQYGSFIRDNLLATGDKYCNVCGNSVKAFLPLGIKEDLFKQHHIIGGGYRKNCTCPCCGVGDRERWLYYVLKNKTDIFRISGRVLHFAPEYYMKKEIGQNGNVDYYMCDIAPGQGMHIIDITDIPFREQTFDYVISNHVMEHVPNEAAAVSEIKRVLKQGGRWIFSFPICTDQKTYEDETIVLPKDRLREYGQEDHVRLYGFDYKERFEKYGLKLEIFSPENEMSKKAIMQYGFIKDDVIIIARVDE